MTCWNIDFYAIDQSRETCTDFDTLYEYTSCIWPSFVYHSRLTICDCLRFTKVCFCPYTSEIQFCLNDINSSVMPRLDENQCPRAIGVLQAGLAQNIVARHFGCHRNTILSLWRRFRQSGNTRNHRRSGCPRVTSRRQDNHIRLVHLRNRFQTSNLTVRNIPGLRPISSRTVRNRLREHNIRPRRPAIRPMLLPRHRTARLTWCRRYLRFRIQEWANILFTDESRFHLGQQWWPFSCLQPCRRTICRRLRHSTSIVWWWQCYGVGRHSSTWQNTIGCCRRKSDRYTLSGWDDVVQPYVIPFIQAQANNVIFQQDNARPHVARVVRDYLT
jgi:transposase